MGSQLLHPPAMGIHSLFLEPLILFFIGSALKVDPLTSRGRPGGCPETHRGVLGGNGWIGGIFVNPIAIKKREHI